MLAGIVRDDVDALKETVLSYLIQADAFISSGGVSVGERDVVKAAFFRRGDVDFYKVAMQPGMPQGFGHIEGKPYFGLPGNPVSVFVSFEVFVRPAILKMMGRTQLFRPEVTATLDGGRRGPEGQAAVRPRARLERSDDGWIATPTGARGSNLISTVVAGERSRDDPGRDRRRPGRLGGPRDGVPLLGGLTVAATGGADGIVEVGERSEVTRPRGDVAECMPHHDPRGRARTWSPARRRATRSRRPRSPA